MAVAKKPKDEATYNNLSRDEVVAYLKAHPDFLDQNPDLLRVLTPPAYHNGERVVDMQRFMMERLRQQIEHVQKEFTDLIFSARDNMTAQGQIHEAVVQLLACDSIEGLIHIISADLQRIFAVDTVKLCVEADVAPFQDTEYTALQFMPVGTVQRLLGEQTVLLGAVGEAAVHVFGSAAPLVASQALVRLHFVGYPKPGLIAFGVRHAEQFHAGQATDLLRFLGHVVEHCVVRIWKDARQDAEKR